MNILTKPNTVLKGTPALFSIDKTALVSLFPVAQDAYFSTISNWSRIYLFYKSAQGRQSETVAFDARLTTPSSFFDVSVHARDVFELENIIIFDFDNAALVIPRDQVPNAAAEFDVTLT